jgi:Spy/CpxP family protein refolding chaperone
MRKSLLTVIVAGMLAGAGGLYAANGEAGPKGPPPKNGKERPAMNEKRPPGPEMREMLDELKLTEEQKPQVKKVMEAHREKMEKYRADHKDEMEKARAEMKAAHESKDEAAIKAAKEKMEALMKDAPKPTELLADLKPILTEDQYKLASERIAKIQEHRQKMRENGRPGPGKDGPGGDKPPHPKPPEGKGGPKDGPQDPAPNA